MFINIFYKMIEIMKLEAAYLIFKNSNCVKYLVFIFLVFNASHVYAAKSVNDKTTLTNGYYPLEITVNGHEYSYDASKKNTYNNQIYKIKYEPKKGYQKPKDYPL